MQNITIITSSLAPTVGIFTPEQRTMQTLKGIESVREKIPGLILVVDVSLFPIEHLRQQVANSVDIFLDVVNQKDIVEYSRRGLKSHGELLLFKTALDYIKQHYDINDLNRIFKLSGRCNITPEFTLDDYLDSYGKYVFKKSLQSWISPNMRLYETRFWSMCSSMINDYLRRFDDFFKALDGQFDIEHTYYKSLDKDKVLEFDNVWVEGNIAPNGRYQKD